MTYSLSEQILTRDSTWTCWHMMTHMTCLCSFYGFSLVSSVKGVIFFHLCLFVGWQVGWMVCCCLFVSRIPNKLPNRPLRNLDRGWISAQNGPPLTFGLDLGSRSHSILYCEIGVFFSTFLLTCQGIIHGSGWRKSGVFRWPVAMSEKNLMAIKIRIWI